jgi:autotransporter-associated beta strand protein
MKSPACSVSPWRVLARALLPMLLLAHTGLHAASWYVATTGSDANAGTQAAPFATVMRAQTAAASGDVVYIRGGTYDTFTIAFTDSNYNYVHRLSKAGVTYSAYPGETPVFDFSSVPTNLRVCGFHVTGGNITIIGFNVTGTKVGAQKQSENFRIDGSAASCDFYYCVVHDTAGNGFYFTNHAGGSCNYCDSYNNIGTSSDSIGNTDGFGAHGRSVAFRYCRSWHNSDDGYDCISTDQGASHTFDHCWAYNMTAGGDSNGFKVGGYGSGSVPATVPVHTVTYCLAANNAAHGFYANHQPGQAAVWTHNTAFNNSAGNFDMLERVSVTDATDIPGYREVLHFNLAFQGTITRDDATPPENATNNSWTSGITPTAADFLSVDASQMIQPRAGGLMPFINFMHLTSASALNGLGCFDPAPGSPSSVSAHWVTGSRIDVVWSAPAGAATYNVKRSLTSGGPYTYIATGVTGTSFSDTTVSSGTTTYYYAVTAMSATSFDESANSAQAIAVQGPSATITGVSPDTGRSTGDAITNAAAITLLGTTSAASASVSVFENGATVGSASADASGHWSLSSGSLLADGTHNFTAVASVSGVSGVESAPFAVTIDTNAPAAPTLLVSGSGPFSFSGLAEPSAAVAVTQAGTGVIASTIADATGNWSANSSGTVPPGNYSFSAAATDIAGNMGGSSAPATVDTSIAAPAFTGIIADTGVVNNDQVTSDSTLVLNGTATAGASVTVSRAGVGVIGTATASASGTWTLDYTAVPLTAGSHTFTAIATDGANSSPQSVPFTVVIDTSAPVVTAVTRQSPTAATISPAVTSVVFRATFSEPVYGVTTGSFTLTTTGTAGGTIATVSASNGATIDVTVSGLTGEGTLRLDVPAGGGLTDLAGNLLAGGFTAGDSYSRVASGNGTWTRTTTGGLWSDGANWLGTVIADGAANGADFSTVDVTGTNNVHLDSPRTLNRLTFGDTAVTSAGGWLVDGSMLTLAGSTPRITVNALGTGANVTFTAPLAGTAGLAKDGTGTLALAANNSVSGPLSLTAGTLQVPGGGRLALTAAAALSGNATLAVNGGSFSTTAGASLASANLSVSAGGTLSLGGALTINSNKDGVITVSGGTFSAPDLNIARSTDGTINFAFGFIVSGGAANLGSLEVGTLNSNGLVSVEGGALTVSGPVVVGNQTTGGRGGGLRVTSGSLAAPDTSLGLVLAKTNGANANNVATAAFSGGTATLGKITLGFDSTVTAGSGAVTISGGTVYLGAGGIEKKGAAGMTSTVTVSSGTLAAAADWTTTHPIVFSGASTVKAADAGNAPFNITLGGVLSGAGTITKTGGGVLTLAAVNTSTGSVNINAGTLNVTGSLAAAGAVTVNSTGTLAGTGTINKPITLNAGGIISPAGTVIGTLTASAVTWNGGGTLTADLDGNGNSDRLGLTGALTRGAAGTFGFAFTSSTGLAAGNVYTLASFASTNFTAADFSYAGLPDGFAGTFSIAGNQLRFAIIGTPAITSASTAGGVFGSPFSYQIAASNGPVTYNATDLPPGLSVDPASGIVSGSPAAAGSFTMNVTATNAAGTATAPVAVSIASAPASILLGNLAVTYDGAAHSAAVSTSPAGLAVNLTYDGNATPPVNAGSYAVAATIANPNFTGSATGTLVVGKAPAAVTLGSLAQTYDGAPKPVSAVTNPAGLNLALTYDGSTTAPTNAGSYAVVATVTDANYVGTTNGTLVISSAPATITLAGLTQPYDGTPRVVTASTTPADLHVDLTYNGGTTPPTLPGTYAVTATINDANHTGALSGTLTVTITALVRHAPTLNGDVDGSLQVLAGENFAINGGNYILGDILVAGTPTVKLSGHPQLTGIQDAGGAATPANYTLTLSGNSVARYVVRRVDPLDLPLVAAPSAPVGTRDVVVNSGGQDIGDFATVRNLTLNSTAGSRVIPAGVYGNFTASGNSALVLGVADATEPSVYQLQQLTLNGSATLQIAGPVVLTLANGVTLSSVAGASDQPEWLDLHIANGGVTLNGQATLHGVVTAPNGTVIINGGATLHGRVSADHLTLNGNGVLSDPHALIP